MQNGKINKLLKYYQKHKRLNLGLLWLSLLVSASAVLFLYLMDLEEWLIYLVLVIALIADYIIVISRKSKIAYYTMQASYYRLLIEGQPIEKTSCMFDIAWEKRLRQTYQMFADKPDFTVYYRIAKSVSKRAFHRSQTLELVTIIKNEDLDLYADQMEQVYKKIWFKHEKKDHLNKQIIIQFKKYLSYDDKVKDDLDRIICYKDGNSALISITCGYFPKTQEIYYLHAARYAPNIFYHHAVTIIQNLIQ